MRIITGTLKGRKINIPKTLNVRPTADRTKEGIFSMIEARKYIRDARILDLFAGSGNLGFEALSRGASTVLFVDNDRQNIRHIEKTAGQFDVASRVRTATFAAENYLKGPAASYDIVFADPPYDYPLMKEMIESVLSEGWLRENGWFILEHDKRNNFSGHDRCSLTKAYGRTIVSIFTLDAGEEEG